MFETLQNAHLKPAAPVEEEGDVKRRPILRGIILVFNMLIFMGKCRYF